VQVNVDAGREAATVAGVDQQLNALRSAVSNLGGAVEVASVGAGVVVLRYRGPPAIGKGLAAAVQDAFPDVKQVVLQDMPTA
jgi:Fe-S cluster biogenesis protein NfuA